MCNYRRREREERGREKNKKKQMKKQPIGLFSWYYIASPAKSISLFNMLKVWIYHILSNVNLVYAGAWSTPLWTIGNLRGLWDKRLLINNISKLPPDTLLSLCTLV